MTDHGETHEADLAPDERRRELLRGILVVAAASGLLGASDSLSNTTRRIGRSDVARINAVTGLYRSLDYEVGGGALVTDVARFAESASTLLNMSYSSKVAPGLFSSVAAARQLAGWTALDAGNHSDAQRHFVAAERAAIAAQDAPLTARIRYCQARQFQHLRHNRDALDTLRLAQADLGPAATPATSAMLHGAQAASVAALGDWDSALAHLSAASTAYDRVVVEDEPEWMLYFDQGELLAKYGQVYRDLARVDPRQGRAAVRWVSSAIGAFGPQSLRSIVLNEVGLCSALFLADEPEQAVIVGHRVLDRAKRLHSRRVADRIFNLQRDLVRYQKLPDVADFAHAVSSVGRPEVQ